MPSLFCDFMPNLSWECPFLTWLLTGIQRWLEIMAGKFFMHVGADLRNLGKSN
jgi:hypothetical protein